MSEYIIKRSDGTQRRVSGYQYAAPKAGTKKYSSKRYNSETLPRKVDLREYMTTVEDQGQVGSCTANAVAGAYEYLVKRHQGVENYDVSRLFIYYNARKYRNEEKEDAGSVISLAIDGLKEYGACSEDTWPYDTDSVFKKPAKNAYEEAAQFLVDNTELIPTDLHAWKHALAEGYPIIFGIALFDSFDKQKKKGLVPAPTNRETSRESHGNHAMLCVGYSDADRVFIVRNSWGEDWGDSGYCYIPYDYLINEKYNGGDSWIIKKVEDIPDAEEMWGDDTSLLVDMETELANMPDDLYSEMIDEMGEWGLEYRLGTILLTAAGADAEISQEEIAEISEYMQKLLNTLGIDMEAEAVLNYCLDSVGDVDFLQESIELMGKYLSTSVLASITSDINRIAAVDELSEEEENFIFALISEWQIEDDTEEETPKKKDTSKKKKNIFMQEVEEEEEEEEEEEYEEEEEEYEEEEEEEEEYEEEEEEEEEEYEEEEEEEYEEEEEEEEEEDEEEYEEDEEEYEEDEEEYEEDEEEYEEDEEEYEEDEE